MASRPLADRSKTWNAIVQAFALFARIDGSQRAAAFAYYALFSLFPLAVLFVTIGSTFIDRNEAIAAVIGYTEVYVPLETKMEHQVFETITGVINARGRVSAVAVVALIWSSLRFFTALIRATSRAWESDTHNWWQMPLKSLSLLGVLASALTLGVVAPLLVAVVQSYLPALYGFSGWLSTVAITIIPTLVLFYGLVLFYRLAPRRKIRFADVWPAALGALVLLRLLEMLFGLYLRNFGNFNVVYGTVAGIMALLTWIYLSGCIVVWGACFAAAQAKMPKAT